MLLKVLTLALGAVIGLGRLNLAQARHGQEKGPTVKTLSVVNLDKGLELNGKATQATTLEVTYEPDAASTPHRHPGPVFGYVLEGEFEFQAGDAPARRLKAGDTFYEPARVLHAVSRNPSAKSRTRLLAIIVHARDAKELVVPEQPKTEE